MCAALHDRSVLIDDVYSESRFDLRHPGVDRASAHRTVSISPRGGKPIGWRASPRHRGRAHFDDRLGLSGAELERRAATPPAPLPASEHLLCDRPSDLIPRNAAQMLGPAFGVGMQVPEHLYNLCELYNPSVRRGTLNAEERFKISEHMVHTIMMLERMPFPQNLASGVYLTFARQHLTPAQIDVDDVTPYLVQPTA